MVTFRVHEDATARYVKLIFAIFNVFHNRQSIEIEGHFSTKFDNYLAVHEENSHLPFRMDSFVHGNVFLYTNNRDYVKVLHLTMYVEQHTPTTKTT